MGRGGHDLKNKNKLKNMKIATFYFRKMCYTMSPSLKLQNHCAGNENTVGRQLAGKAIMSQQLLGYYTKMSSKR